MIIQKFLDPIPFLKISNTFTELELKLIWQELDFLTHPIKLLPPEKCGTAFDENKKPLKNNQGLYLDTLYSRRELSNILSINPKIFSEDILDIFSSLSFGYRNIHLTNHDQTLISYYDVGGYYKPHQDHALYSSLTWFYKEPKQFSGGDFYFSDYNIKINIENNTTIIFPSFLNHSVDKIESQSDIPLGYGRYVMAQFLQLYPKNYDQPISE